MNRFNKVLLTLQLRIIINIKVISKYIWLEEQQYLP